MKNMDQEIQTILLFFGIIIAFLLIITGPTLWYKWKKRK